MYNLLVGAVEGTFMAVTMAMIFISWDMGPLKTMVKKKATSIEVELRPQVPGPR